MNRLPCHHFPYNFLQKMTVNQYIESVNSKADPNKNLVAKEMFFKKDRR